MKAKEAQLADAIQAWRQPFFQFLEENSGSMFYHATTHDQVEIIYCPDKERGYGFSTEVAQGRYKPRDSRNCREITPTRYEDLCRFGGRCLDEEATLLLCCARATGISFPEHLCCSRNARFDRAQSLLLAHSRDGGTNLEPLEFSSWNMRQMIVDH